MTSGKYSFLETILTDARKSLAAREARFREAHHLHLKESPEDEGNPFLEMAHAMDARLGALRRLSELAQKIPVPISGEPDFMEPMNAEIREYAEALREACLVNGDDFSGIHPEYLETLLLQKKGMLENFCDVT